jgi:hypothetical protein
MWVAVVGISLFGYFGALVLLILRGFDREGRWQGRPGWIWAGVALVCFLVWTQALLRA